MSESVFVGVNWLRGAGTDCHDGGAPWTASWCFNKAADNLEAALKDAERYRWLKANHLQLGPDCWIRSGDDLDEAIDAEIAKLSTSDTATPNADSNSQSK